MASANRSALLVLAMLALSSSPLAIACTSCGSGTPSTGGAPAVTLPTLPHVGLPKLPIGIPPVTGDGSPATLPPVLGAVPPVLGAIPPVLGAVPPVLGAVPPLLGAVPPVLGGGSPVTVPPITVPPVLGGSSPVTLPPIPVIGGGSPASPSPKVRHGGRKACPPPPSPPTPTPSSDTCPIDALKLGVCVDLLGNDVHVGDTHVQCCPLVKGVAGLSAAACLCTAIKAKVLDLSLYVPLALKLLVNCGCAVPPGYTCA